MHIIFMPKETYSQYESKDKNKLIIVIQLIQ